MKTAASPSTTVSTLLGFAPVASSVPAVESAPAADPTAARAREALAALQLWQETRQRADRERQRIRRWVLAAHPAARPLLDTLDTLHALAALRQFTPRTAAECVRVLVQQLPAEQPAEQPASAQLRAHLVRAAVTESRADSATEPATITLETTLEITTETELARLHALAGPQILRRLVQDVSAAGYRTATALLVPVYLRLLGAEARFLAGGEGSENTARATDDEGLGLGDFVAADAAAEQSAHEADATSPPETQTLQPVNPRGAQRLLLDRPRAGATDGFAADPAQDSAAGADPEAERAWSRVRKSAAGHHAPGHLAVQQAALGAYRSCLAQFLPEIARTRRVWQQLLHAQKQPRYRAGVLTDTSGSVLNTLALARTYAEAVSGVQTPSAFVRDRLRPRTRQHWGGADYLLVLDCSASMQGFAAHTAAQATVIMLESINAVNTDILGSASGALGGYGTAAANGHQVAGARPQPLFSGVIAFNAAAHLIKPLEATLSDTVRLRVWQRLQRADSTTSGGAALALARQELRRAAAQRAVSAGATSAGGHIPTQADRAAQAGSVARQVVIYVSDGQSDDEPLLFAELARLRRKGVRVVGISLGEVAGMDAFAPQLIRLCSARQLPLALTGLLQRRVPGS